LQPTHLFKKVDLRKKAFILTDTLENFGIEGQSLLAWLVVPGEELAQFS